MREIVNVTYIEDVMSHFYTRRLDELELNDLIDLKCIIDKHYYTKIGELNAKENTSKNIFS